MLWNLCVALLLRLALSACSSLLLLSEHESDKEQWPIDLFFTSYSIESSSFLWFDLKHEKKP